MNIKRKFDRAKRRLFKRNNREKTREYIKRNDLEGKYGEVWLWSAIEPESKYLFPETLGTRERKYGLSFIKDIQKLRANGQDLLLFQTDNYDVYEGILKECYAEKVYSYFVGSKSRAKIPKKVKMPKNLLYTVLKKKRNNDGDIEEIEAKVVFGNKQNILAVLKAHNPAQGINTSYIERSNLSRRHFNARLRRKTLAFSKKYECLVAQLNLQRIYYNFCWAHSTLTKRFGAQTSPAMAIKAVQRLYVLEDIFFYQLLGMSRT